MARPSNRQARRRQICEALERCLARDGLGGATMAAVAAEAGIAPGLIHHHFEDRHDLVLELIRLLARRFRDELPDEPEPSRYLDLYVTAALGRRGARRRATARPGWGSSPRPFGSLRCARCCGVRSTPSWCDSLAWRGVPV